MKKIKLLGLCLAIILLAACSAPSGAESICSLTIDCSTVLDNMDKLAKGKAELIPEDGIMLQLDAASFTEGETVFDVVKRELQKGSIHFEYSANPIDGSAYIEAIGNLYEFDCGELSGWEYQVNGSFQSTSCSGYKLSDGDKISWLYTCDLGADVGFVE